MAIILKHIQCDNSEVSKALRNGSDTGSRVCFQSIIRLIQCSLQKAVRSWPNKHNLITLQIKVSYLSPDFK